MIDHSGVSVSNVGKSKAFYRAALAPLGYTMLMEWEQFAGFGVAPKPDFWIGEGKPNVPPIHIAFRAESRAQVDAFYRAAMTGRHGQRSSWTSPAIPSRLLCRLCAGPRWPQHRGGLP
jgi:hypothetical protein